MVNIAIFSVEMDVLPHKAKFKSDTNTEKFEYSENVQ